MSVLKMDLLVQAITKEWADLSVGDDVIQVAQDIKKRVGSSVCGLLYYGSCLRTGELKEKILDFYVIVHSYAETYGKGYLALANKIIPPNVFYHEYHCEGEILRAKYAVLSLEDYLFRTSSKCMNVSVWARFCQPCLLMLPQNEDVSHSLAQATATAIDTMLGTALYQAVLQKSRKNPDTLFENSSDSIRHMHEPSCEGARETILEESIAETKKIQNFQTVAGVKVGEDYEGKERQNVTDKDVLPRLKTHLLESEDLWVCAFSLTYGAELRSEKPEKAQEVYALDQERYDHIFQLWRQSCAENYPKELQCYLLDGHLKCQPSFRFKVLDHSFWLLRRLNGKMVSLLRLIKAISTFEGGIDYLAWKISRHSGVKIDIKPWMRKYPLIAGGLLFFSVRKKGAFR